MYLYNKKKATSNGSSFYGEEYFILGGYDFYIPS